MRLVPYFPATSEWIHAKQYYKAILVRLGYGTKQIGLLLNVGIGSLPALVPGDQSSYKSAAASLLQQQLVNMILYV